jgi:hypothetical protein
MPDTDRPELLGARPIGRSERIPVTRHVDRTWTGIGFAEARENL